MYIRIFDDGPRACGADTLEWVPMWWVSFGISDCHVDLLHPCRYGIEGR